LKDYHNAYEWFNHAIMVDDKWSDAHYGLVLCCLQLEKYDEAVDHIEKAKMWGMRDY
jgi:tetratricopeptide (TPR) repeat protein